MTQSPATVSDPSETLTARQQAILPIAALAAAGDLARLNTALERGLDAGLSVSDAKEVLVQLYAYAGFPRSLNALGELMKVLDARKQRGVRTHLAARRTALFRREKPCWLPVLQTRQSYPAHR